MPRVGSEAMILIVAGVAGCGKTTVGELVAKRLGWTFADGDDFHPEASIAKMQAGLPLTDADREPWLDAIGAWIDERIRLGQSAVVACSALKRSYREKLLAGRDQVRMAWLSVSWQDDEERVLARKGHFFTEPLLASQFAIQEPPRDEDRVYVITSEGRPADQVAAAIIERLGLR
jgi:gluconokinase